MLQLIHLSPLPLIQNISLHHNWYRTSHLLPMIQNISPVTNDTEHLTSLPMIQNISPVTNDTKHLPVTNDTEHLTMLHVTHTSQLIQNWSVFLWGTHRSVSVMKRPLSGSLTDSLTAPAHTNTSDSFYITLTILYNFEISIFDLYKGKVFINIRCKSLLLFKQPPVVL